MAENQNPVPSSATPLIPIVATVARTSALSGLSRSEIYRLLGTGKIRGLKSGRSTLVDFESVRAHLASLPPAMIRAPAPRQGS